MRKLLFLFGLLFFLSISLTAQDNKNQYAKEWEKVMEWDKSRNDDSVNTAVANILEKAITDKNIHEIVKAYFYKTHYNYNNKEEKAALFFELENILPTVSEPGYKALIYSILAERYYNYYANVSHCGNKGYLKILSDSAKDPYTWTKDMFLQKITDCLDASLKNPAELHDLSVRQYDEIIEPGIDSETFYPTLYDFLMRRAIAVSKNLVKVMNFESIYVNDKYLHSVNICNADWNIDDWKVTADRFVNMNIGKEPNILALYYYKIYFRDLLERNLMPTIIMTELDKLDYMYYLSHTDGPLINDLKVLQDKYKENPAVILISSEVVKVLMNTYDMRTKPKRDAGENFTDNFLAANCEDAYRTCKSIIEKYPDYPGCKNLSALFSNLELTGLDIKIRYEDGKFIYPERIISAQMRYNNLICLPGMNYLELSKINGTDTTFVKNIPIECKPDNLYLIQSQTLNIGKLPAGFYKLELKGSLRTDSKMMNSSFKGYEETFFVSRIGIYNRVNALGEYEVFVADRLDNEPIENAVVTIYSKKCSDVDGSCTYKALKTGKTNNLGMALFKSMRKWAADPDESETKVELVIGVTSGEEKLLPQYGGYFYVDKLDFSETDRIKRTDRNINTKKDTKIRLLTDRKSFCSGDSVYFKAVATHKEKPVVGKKIKVELIKGNGVLSGSRLTTNEFGSVSGNFVLPESGEYMLQASYDGFYSRTPLASDKNGNRKSSDTPYNIVFENGLRVCLFGQEVTLFGQARSLSGEGIPFADVEYNIDLYNFMGGDKFPADGTGNYINDFVSGRTKTREDGSFEIKIKPEPCSCMNLQDIYVLAVNASLVNVQNDNQRNIPYLLTVAKKHSSRIIGIGIPRLIEKSSDPDIFISIKNLNLEDLAVSGTYEIYAIDGNQFSLDDNNFKLEDVLDDENLVKQSVLKGKFQTTGTQPRLLSDIKRLPSGIYRVNAKSLDGEGNTIEAWADFILYSYHDKRPPYKTSHWLVKKDTFLEKGKDAEIIFGSSADNIHLLYQLYNGNKMCLQDTMIINNENKWIKIPYKKEYGDLLNLCLVYRAGGRFYNKNIELKKITEIDNGELVLEMDTLPVNLQNEKKGAWVLSVKDRENKPVDAEIVASLYNCSSYPFYQNDKSFDAVWVSPKIMSAGSYLPSKYSEGRLFCRCNDEISFGDRLIAGFETKNFQFDRLKGIYKDNCTSSSLYDYKMREWANSYSKYMLTKRLPVTYIEDEGVLEDKKKKPGKHLPNPIKIIRYLENEQSKAVPEKNNGCVNTPYFNPNLKTDDFGKTKIEFKAPDGKGEWFLQAFAHTKDSKSGYFRKKVIVNNTLVSITGINIPDTVGQGDKTTICAKIINLADSSLTVNVGVRFFNPTDFKDIDLMVKDNEQTVTLSKNSSVIIYRTFVVPKGFDKLVCRIIAENFSFNNSIEHVFNILQDRLLVTETMPVIAANAGENLFCFDSFARNNNASRQNYRLTFEFAPDPVCFALRALRSLLDSADGSDIIDKYSDFYARRMSQSILGRYKHKIPEVSFLFPEDMSGLRRTVSGYNRQYPSHEQRNIAQYLLYLLSDLQMYGHIEYEYEMKYTQSQLIKFIDGELQNDLLKLKNNAGDALKDINVVSTSNIEYLYVRSSYRDIPIDMKTHEAEIFFTSVAAGNWKKLNLYERAILSVVLRRNGEKKLAGQICASIREQAVTDSVQGMFWPGQSNTAFLSQSAVCNHIFFMKALIDNGASEEEIDMMKRWLIRQKQLSGWGSKIATIDAVNILFGTYNDSPVTDNSLSRIYVGGQLVNADNGDSEDKYLMKSWDKTQMKPDMAFLKIVRPNDKPVYGFMYWQYYTDGNKTEK